VKLISSSGRRTLAVCVLAASLAGCCPYGVWDVTFDRAEGYADPRGSSPPRLYQLGETVTFVAREEYYEADCHDPAGPSDTDPDAYTWSSSDPSVASVVAPGQVNFASLGPFQLTVSTSHDQEQLDGRVVARVASIRITPASATINAGENVSFLVEALDENGQVIPDIKRSMDAVRIEQPPYDSSNPIAENTVSSDIHDERFVYHGYRPGTVVLTARLPIYGAQHHTATATLVVR
jgi:hypothetical protein